MPIDSAWMVPGALAQYTPAQRGPWFDCVIDSAPWMLSGHTEVVRLRDVEPGYMEYTRRERLTIPCAATWAVRPRGAKL